MALAHAAPGTEPNTAFQSFSGITILFPCGRFRRGAAFAAGFPLRACGRSGPGPRGLWRPRPGRMSAAWAT